MELTNIRNSKGLNQRRRDQLWRAIKVEDARFRAQEKEAILSEQAQLRQHRAASRSGPDVQRQDIASARLKGVEAKRYRRRVIRSLERSEPRQFDPLHPCAFSHSERFLGVELAKLRVSREKERAKRQGRQQGLLGAKVDILL